MHFDRIYVPCDHVTISFKGKRSKHADMDTLCVEDNNRTPDRRNGGGGGGNFELGNYMCKQGEWVGRKRKNSNCHISLTVERYGMILLLKETDKQEYY